MFDIPGAVEKVAGFFGKALDKVVPDAVERERLSIELAQMAFKEAEMAYADRNSAREREKVVKDKVPANLAYIAIGAFVGMAGWVIGGSDGKPGHCICHFGVDHGLRGECLRLLLRG